MIWDVLRGVGSDTIGASSRKELTVNQNYQEGLLEYEWRFKIDGFGKLHAQPKLENGKER